MNEQTNGGTDEAERREELSAYDKLFHDVKLQLEKLTSGVDVHALGDIIAASTEDLKKIESHSMEAVLKASEALKKDLASTAEHTGPLLQAPGENTGKALHTLHDAGAQVWTQLAAGAGGSVETWRDWTGGTFESFFKHLSAASGKLGDELGEALTYHTGEMTHGGTFQCVDCNSSLTLKHPGHLPPCPKCHKTAFRRA